MLSGHQKVIAERGSGAVKLNAPRGGKECYTSYGKTECYDAKFAVPLDVIISHTPFGWTNETAMMEYLAWLS
jgi:hypothetical protein